MPDTPASVLRIWFWIFVATVKAVPVNCWLTGKFDPR
jgi:hypothetical protein